MEIKSDNERTGPMIPKRLDCSLKSAGIIVRPNAGNGFWLCSLLPIALAINTYKHTVAASLDYKIATILAFGLMCQTIGIWIAIASKERPKIFHLLKLIPGTITAFLLVVCLNQEIGFAAFWGFTSTILFNFLYLTTLRRLPRCFTTGEAAIVLQGVTLFWAISIMQIHFWLNVQEMSDMQTMTFIVQIGIMSISVFVILVTFIKLLRNPIPFSLLLLLIASFVVIFPVQDNFAIVTVVQFIIKDIRRIYLILMYCGLLGLSVATVCWQMRKANQASTKIRKIFHLIVVLVFVPGLLWECKFLYLLTALALALFIVLETIRLSDVAPKALDNAVNIFVDEKDAGAVALTPIYLLVGCAIPLWLHPCPCDAAGSTNAELLVLCAGVLSVGVGDTVASFVGSSYGKHKILGSSKSIEGLIANILAQGVAMVLIVLAVNKDLTFATLAIPTVAIVSNAILEAFTDQIDNLVLPLVTFILLSLNGYIRLS